MPSYRPLAGECLCIAVLHLCDVRAPSQPCRENATPAQRIPSEDELPNLFPASEQAERLKAQTFTLAEFLVRNRDRFPPVRREGRAVVHGHCHHTSVFGTDPDREVLNGLGLRYEALDSGCCGMTGALGFEASHYGVSMAIGERVLLRP